MAEKETKPQEKKENKPQKSAKDVVEKKARPQEIQYESLVRIYGFDIPGNKNVYVGLTKIKGISWATANVILIKLEIPRNKKISELSKDEIKKIESSLDNPPLPDFMKNRRLDQETGKTEHLVGTDIDVKKDFDIKRLKKIKSYKGVRHSLKLPVRGQRTRSHFRELGRKSTGIKKKKEAAK